jgi:hypothetical protein
MCLHLRRLFEPLLAFRASLVASIIFFRGPKIVAEAFSVMSEMLSGVHTCGYVGVRSLLSRTADRTPTAVLPFLQFFIRFILKDVGTKKLEWSSEG